MISRTFSSWGSVVRARHAVYSLASRHDAFPRISPGSTVLPYGNGRSYGDSCLNPDGALLRTDALDHFIRFDSDTGVICCEAGVLLADILRLTVPRGWFLPVVPGTAHVTVGGAIANDVHGKNHHRVGSFGNHVRRFELLRSSAERWICSPDEHPEWFAATVGGLGLTGVITWAELQLRPVAGAWMQVETVRFANLDEFCRLCENADSVSEYTVAWIDCLSRGRRLGRGLLQQANHSTHSAPDVPAHDYRIGMPFVPPLSVVNRATLQLFNTLYYHRPRWRTRRHTHFQQFLFPLDRIAHWNRLYGPRGFYQYQCVVPGERAADATASLLQAIARSRQGSFLAVLKRFGAATSPGLLSFPQQGLTLALDFPNSGESLERLFGELDALVAQADGRLYPAKDGRMPGWLFRRGYPQWQEFARYIDPACSSSFWRRVTQEA